MIVTLDGRRIPVSFPADTTLQDVIEGVRGDLSGNRLLVSIALNGEIFSESDLIERLRCSVHTEDQIDFESAEALEVCAAALRELGHCLGDCSDSQREAAARLRAGDAAAGIREVGRIITLWRSLHRAVDQASELTGRDLGGLAFEGRLVRNHLADAAAVLRSVKEALDARDMVRLADIAEFDIPDLCAAWENLLTDVSSQLVDSTGG